MRREAESAGLTGWVRNRPDGDVEGHLEGEAEEIEALLEFIRQGPGRARVEELAVEDAATEDSSEFRIA